MSGRMNQWFAGFVVAGVVMFSGCREEKTDEKKVEASGGDKTVAVQLAAADAYDGTTDKTVSKCLTCGLKKDGSSEHAVTVDGYAVHLCGPDCATKFKEDTTKAILALQVPKE